MKSALLNALRAQVLVAQGDGLETRATYLRGLISAIEARRADPCARAATVNPMAALPTAPPPPARAPQDVAAELRRAGDRLHAADCDCRECIP